MEDIFAGERMSNLFVKFEKEALKKLDKISGDYSEAYKLASKLNDIRDSLRYDMGLSGKEAVKRIWEVMKGRFDVNMQPIPYLYKKYKHDDVDQIVGRFY